MTWSADERVGRILEHVSDGIALVDRDWRFLYANPQAAKLLQRDAQTLVGKVLWDEFPEAVDTEFWDAYHRAMDSQEPQTVESYYGPLQGWFEVRVFPAPEGLTLHFANVTDRRAAHEERERLIRRLTGALRHSEQLLELTDALASALTLQDVANLVTTHARRALGCLFAGISLSDVDRSVMRYVSMAPLPDEVVRKWGEFSLDASVPATDTARVGRPLLYSGREAIVRDYPHIATDLEEAGTEAMATVPLIASRRTIGALMVTWSRPYDCDDDELRFLQTLAGQAAQAIERARLFARQQSVAATLQRAILPQALPTAAGVELAARYEPAEAGIEVGGDWYDAFALPGDRLGLTVGDVAGHGVEAAALMGQLRNATRAHALDDLAPGALVTKLNRLVAHTTETLFATMVFMVLETQTGAIRWSNAGHPPPVVVRPSREAQFLEEVHGPPLGVDSGATFAEAQRDVSGGTVLLYTDGLVEHRARSISDGLATLLQVASAAPLADLERFCDEVSGRVLPDGGREDDMCLLAARHSFCDLSDRR